MTFKTKKELIQQALKDGACLTGIKWAEEQVDLETIIKNIPEQYLSWVLEQGYEQFLESPNIKKITSSLLPKLIKLYPQLANYCDWSNFDGWDWAYLLSTHHQYADHCDWEMLDGYDWTLLLKNVPQFAEYCDWCKLDGDDWACLLRHQPQFAEHPEYIKFRQGG